jgi:methylglutaconyl-CoA hydratase
MAEENSSEVELQQTGAVLTIALNRPRYHNSLTASLTAALTAQFKSVCRRDDVRVVVLTGRGGSFCAGADLNHMRAAAAFSYADNVADGKAMFDLMMSIDQCPKPVVGRINGSAIGGGVGLVSCCDIAIAVEDARFGFSEVLLGLVPAVISPFVLAKIGGALARELFLTGSRFDATEGMRIGLLNRVAAGEDELDQMVDAVVGQLLLAAPGAQGAAKELIRNVLGRPGHEVRDYTSQFIAQCRASPEGMEGMSSFLEKRSPDWQDV